MQTVARLLESKQSLDVCTISPEATVFDAIKVFAENNLGALIVTEQGFLRGLITERDYARKVILQGRSSKETTVKDIMTENIIYVSPNDTISACMEVMLNKYIRHLPVVEDGRLIGIISMGDVVKSVLSQQIQTIDNLVESRRSSPPQSIKRPATFRLILRAVPYAHDSMAAPCMLKRVGGIKQSSACRPWLLCQSSFEVMELRQKAQSGVSTWSPMKCFMQCSCNVGEHASLDRCF